MAKSHSSWHPCRLELDRTAETFSLVAAAPCHEILPSIRSPDHTAALYSNGQRSPSATATFLFRQFFLTIPGELVEAARIDNAGPFRFMRDILLPLSKTNIAALFVILFIYGWTQYLWPLLVTNDSRMNTIIIGLRKMVDFADASTPWNYVMVTAILAIIPPVVVVVLMQQWFVKGLVETEK